MKMMTSEEFNKSIEEQIKRIEDSLVKKNKEYADSQPPLHNFHESAKASRTTPIVSAYMFMIKHFTSITDMIQSSKDYPMELWKEKLGDMKNYLILIECLVEEEKANKSSKK
mgnify:CR=1 FL=1